MAYFFQRFPEPGGVTLDLMIVIQDGFIRICINHTKPAIQYQRFTLPEEIPGLAHAEDRRYPQTAGKYGGVAVGSAVLRDNSSHPFLVQDGEFAWGQFRGDDQCFGETVGNILKRFACGLFAQLALHQANHLDNVFTARPDVFVIKTPEFGQYLFKLGLKRPLRIAQFPADVVLGILPDFGVVQHHHVRVDDFTGRVPHITCDPFCQSLELPGGCLHGLLVAKHFSFGFILGNSVFTDFEFIPLGQMGLSYRDAASDRVTSQGQGHVNLSIFAECMPGLLFLAESTIDQLGDVLDCLVFIFSLGLDGQFGALTRSQCQHPHDGLSIDGFLTVADP